MYRNLRNSASAKPKIKRYSFFIVGSLLIAALFGIFMTNDTDSHSNNPTQTMSLDVYPNPASDWVQIELGQEADGELLYIQNVSGKSMINKTLTQEEGKDIRIDVSTWEKGDYKILLKSRGGVITRNLSVH